MANNRLEKNHSDIMERPLYQANPLIESQKHMSLAEIRLFALGMQALRPQLSQSFSDYDKEFPLSIVPIDDLERAFADNNGGLQHMKRSITTAFQRAYIQIKMKHGGYRLRHIFQELEYIPKVGLKIQFDPVLRPYILDLVNQPYTVATMKYVFPLSSDYAWRISELMLQYKGMAKEVPDNLNVREITRRIEMADLRFMLDIPKTKYQGRIDNFKKRVLDEPIQEINEKTAYHVSYTVEKAGRDVTAFIFKMLVPVSILNPPTITIENSEASNTPKKLLAPKLTFQSAKKEKPALSKPPLTVEMSGMSEADFTTHVKHDMKQIGLAMRRINKWISNYGVNYANKLFRYGLKQADKQGIEGRGRMLYVAKCMDDDWIFQNKKAKEENKQARVRQKTTKFPDMQAELEIFAANNNIDLSEPNKPMEEDMARSVVKADIRNGRLSLTSRRMLAQCRMSVQNFYELYMKDTN